MRVRNQFDLEKVSGGGVLATIGAIAGVIAVADAAWSAGKGIVAGWND